MSSHRFHLVTNLPFFFSLFLLVDFIPIKLKVPMNPWFWFVLVNYLFPRRFLVPRVW